MATSGRQYFFAEGTERKGPFSLEELKQKELKRGTLVWHSDLDQWKPAGSLPELKELFRLEPPEIDSSSKKHKTRSRASNIIGEKPPKTWLIESVLVTVLCCLPFGLAGLIHAAKVESRFYAGDRRGAESASREAERWTKIGFFTGLGFIVLFFGWYFIVMVLAFWSEIINLI